MKTGNILFYSGIGIMMISIIYMIMNLSTADYFINKWLVAMIAGISFAFWGKIYPVIKRKQNKGV